MAAEWYFKELGKELGPVTSADLRRLAQEGRIGPETWVRRGMGVRWVSASRVKGLFDGVAPAARPSPPAPVARQKPIVEIQPQSFNNTPPSPRSARRGELGVDAEFTEAPNPTRPKSPLLYLAAGVMSMLLIGGIAVGVMMLGGNRGETAKDKVAQNQPPKESPATTQPSTSNPQGEVTPQSAGESPGASPEGVVKAYLAAPTWQERLPHVLNPEQVRAQMARLYANTNFSPDNFLPGTVVSVDNKKAGVGERVLVTIDVSQSSPQPQFPRCTCVVVRTSPLNMSLHVVTLVTVEP